MTRMSREIRFYAASIIVMHIRILALLALAGAVVAGACGDDTGSGGSASTGTQQNASSTSTGTNEIPGLQSIKIDPENAIIEATPSAAGTQTYKVIGTIDGQGDVDITDKVSLSTSTPGLGAFTGPTFSSTTTHGGKTTVLASANAGAVTVSTGLTVHLTASIDGPDGGTPLPTDPGSKFTGTADAARAPQLVYPNDGVLLPPNLHRLEVHYRGGPAANTLFAIEFKSDTADITTYLRCPNPTNGGCIFELDPEGYDYVASSNNGVATKLTVKGGDDAGTGFGVSSEFTVNFAEEDVAGGLYYWTTSGDTGIMRFDFGGSAPMPELYLSPGQNGYPTCVGCHALSRDGTKMVASLGGQNDGRIVFINDVSNPDGAPLKGDAANHVQFASFNPDGSRFVSIYGDADTAQSQKLWMHDGNTGVRIDAEAVDLGFEGDHPDWSPDGATIAFDHVGQHQTSQRPFNCGIDVVRFMNGAWGAPESIVPTAPGINRFNANFAPDSGFFIFTESICPGGNNTDGDCDGDADNPAKTWASLPTQGSTAVRLDGSTKPGVEDGANTNLADTFPRFAPFQNGYHGGRLFWATVSSRRHLGLRDPAGHQLLWMFAIDPDKILAGQDGSYPAFFLPFQDLTTSNHIAQWTTQIVAVPQ